MRVFCVLTLPNKKSQQSQLTLNHHRSKARRRFLLKGRWIIISVSLVGLMAQKKGAQRYLVKIEGMDIKKSLKGMKLRVTIVEDMRASEHNVIVQ